MLSQAKFTLFVLLALSIAFTSAQNSNIAVAEVSQADNNSLAINSNVRDGWVTIPSNLQQIGGNTDGQIHYVGALQFGAQAIAAHAVTLGLFSSSDASMVKRNSRYYTFNRHKVGNYSIGLTIRSAAGQQLDAYMQIVVSNSGNWIVSHYNFSFYRKNNMQVDQISVIFDNNVWRYQLLGSNVNAGSNQVYNVPQPVLGISQSLNNVLATHGYSKINFNTLLNSPDLIWILRYGANFVLTQAHNNAIMTVEDPSDFYIDKVWAAYQLKHSSSTEYEFELQLVAGSGQSIRLSFHIVRSTKGFNYISLNSWSVSTIIVDGNTNASLSN